MSLGIMASCGWELLALWSGLLSECAYGIDADPVHAAMPSLEGCQVLMGVSPSGVCLFVCLSVCLSMSELGSVVSYSRCSLTRSVCRVRERRELLALLSYSLCLSVCLSESVCLSASLSV